MDVSVIFATHNREDVLKDVFKRWKEVLKFTRYEFEIICSDDASSDNTVRIIEDASVDIPVILIRNKKGGAGKARNQALKVAKGKLVIFTGDDMFPCRDFVNRHYENYLKYGDNIATLGRIDWHNDIDLNHLMLHITEIGCEQFGFIALPPHQLIDFRHFYTSNISVSKRLLDEQEIHFSSKFDKYGFEDIELGYRLQKNGMKIIYDPDIIIEHHHIYESVEKFCIRQRNAGEELIVFNDIHSDLEGKCICDIENCKNAFFAYKRKHKKSFSASGMVIAFVVNLLIKSTKLLEFIIWKRKSRFAEKLCSIIYADLFQYFFFYGCVLRIAENTNAGQSQIRQFAYEYLKKPYSQIYWDIGYGYNETDSRKWKCWDEDLFILEHILPADVCELRISPLKNRCIAWIESIQIESKDANLRNPDIFWHNACKTDGRYFDFSHTNDPQIVIRLSNNDKKIIIKLKAEEMEKRGLLRTVKRFLFKVYRSIKKNAEKAASWEVNYAYGERRKVQIGILCTDENLKQMMIKRYTEAVSIFGESACVSDSEAMQRGYSDYIYAPVMKPIEDEQFRQIAYTLLNNIYDYIFMSHSYDAFPQMACDAIDDVFIYSKLLIGDSIQEKCKNSTGRFLRIPVCQSEHGRIDLTDYVCDIKLSKDHILNCYGLSVPEFRMSARQFNYIKRKPVIFVVPIFLAVGGVERNTIETMRSLQDEYDFCLITMERHTLEQGSLHYQLKGICNYIFDLKELFEFKDYLDVLFELKNIFMPDLIWLCNNSPWLEENLMQFRQVFFDSPIVAQDVYDTDAGWIQYYDRPAIKTIDRFIAVTQLIKDTFINKYSIPEEKIDLIYSVVDADKIQKELDADVKREDVCKEYKLNINKKHFAFVGRLTEQKNPIRYLSMIKKIMEKYPEEMEFLLIGDGICSTTVEKYINNENMDHMIARIPFISNTPRFIKMLDGLIMTSEYEGMPIVTIEAMSVGTPILSTDVGDLRRFLDKTQGGMLFDETKTDFENFVDFNEQLVDMRQHAEENAADMLRFFSADRQKVLYKKVFLESIDTYRKEVADE